MKIAITQSNYFPWRGWFALVRSADHLVIYDSAQFTKRDWRNRNRLVVEDKEIWLTVPVTSRGKFNQRINETRVVDSSWTASHIGIIRAAAKRYRADSEVLDELVEFISSLSQFDLLSEINRKSIEWVMTKLRVSTTIENDSSFDFHGNPSARLAQIASQAGASTYITGNAAENYLDTNEFTDRGISVEWADYSALATRADEQEIYLQGSIIEIILRYGYEEATRLSAFNHW